VVAVVGDVRSAGLDSMPRASLYFSLGQFPWDAAHLVVRAEGEPTRLAGAVARELHAVDPELPLADVRTFESYLGESVATRRFVMLLLAAFSVVAVVLSGIGIAGVMANAIVQRTREIGVRLALGAQPGDVLAMVLRQGMRLVAAGLVIGLLGAFALTRVLQSLLYGTTPTDLPTYAAVALLLGAVALVATWLPARRATRVDPAVALQAE
jgi:putative ABC transport system permease protein